MSLRVSNKQKKYRTTGKTVFSCQYHVIWCTKFRRKVLDGTIQSRLKELILEKQDEYLYEILEMETQVEHVHLLVEIPTMLSVDQVIGKIKSYSAKVLREEYPQLKSRLPSLWTRSKFVSTCGGVTLEVIKQYIEDQSGK